MFFRLLSAFMLFSGLALSTLNPDHPNPQGSVYAELLIALAVLLGFAAHALAQEGKMALLGGPVVAVVLIWVLAVLTWQISLPGLAYAMYASLFLLCYWFAAGGQGPFSSAVACGLLVCALLQSFVGLPQLAGWSLGGWVVQKADLRVFGNIAQSNHYADLVFLGLGSLAFLFARGRLNRWLMIALAFWLALAAAASSSRTVLLYICVFAVLGGWACWRGDRAARLAGQALLMIAAFSVLAQLMIAYGHILDAFGVTSGFERATGAVATDLNGLRRFFWNAAWQAIQSHPWLGQGPDSFFKASVDAMFLTPPASFSKLGEHAHNLPLNLAVEFGVPLALLVMAVFIGWFFRHLLRPATETSVWALACVGIIGLHSMVEYPLWYAYFLVPCALCMGFADAEGRCFPVIRIPRWAGLIMSMAALAVLVWGVLDWFTVRLAYLQLTNENSIFSDIVRVSARDDLNRVSPYSVFARQAENLRIQSWRPNDGEADSVADRCDVFWQYSPRGLMMMRCGEVYALTAREASLNRLAVALCDGFPSYHPVLHDWAKRFDLKEIARVKIAKRSCL